MNDDNIIERLEEFIELDSSTTNSFANRAGIDPGNLRKMLAGKQRITDKTLRKIADANDLSFEWLKYGEGDMYMPDDKPLPVKTSAPINTPATINKPAPIINYKEGVPYYNEDFMLGFEEIGTPDSENPDFLIRMPGYERATLWCNASGHSMEPEINNGDIIALQRVEDFSFLPFGDVYGFITANGMRTIKRLGRSERDGFYRLIPTNKEYDEQEIPINIITHVYRVMGTMKAF